MTFSVLGYPADAMNLADVLKASPEKRDQLRELTALKPLWNLKILVLLGMWILAGWAIVSSDLLVVRIPAWIVIGMVIHSFAIFLHESVHGLLFKNAFLNRWVGFLCGVPALIAVAGYRAIHLPHHAHTRTPEDPDEMLVEGTPPWLARIGLYLWLIGGGPYYIFLHVPFKGFMITDSKTRREMVVEYTLIYAVLAGVIYAAYSAGRMDLFFNLWLIPAAVALVLVNLRGAAEHIMCVADDDFTDSRTVTSNRAISFAMNNLNYHLEHHLVARVPWYNLKRFHAIMRDEYAAANSHIRKSYVSFIVELIIKGPLGEETWHRRGLADSNYKRAPLGSTT